MFIQRPKPLVAEIVPGADGAEVAVSFTGRIVGVLVADGKIVIVGLAVANGKVVMLLSVRVARALVADAAAIVWVVVAVV